MSRATAAPRLEAPRHFRAGSAPVQRAALAVSSPQDAAEHEAADAARRVVAMPAPAHVGASRSGPLIQRAAALPTAAGVPEDTGARIAARQGGGMPLPAPLIRFMGPRFGADFSAVRIHTDGEAARLAQRLSARAFTRGGDIFFNRGQFQPDSANGRELIAHELAHTIQQGAAPRADRPVQRAVQDTVPALSLSAQPAGRIQRLGLSDILDGLAELAANMPGFTLLTLIIGRNPINLRTVERSAVNLLRAFMGLIPGGELLFQVLQRQGVIARIGSWVQTQTAALGLSFQIVRDAFSRFTDSLSWTDIFRPSDVWNRARGIFTPLIERVTGFVSQLISQAVSWLKETFMQPLADFCQQIPGYGLIKVMLGRDPFTNAPVPRTALTVVRAFAEFIPGGTEKVDQLVQSGALERAYAWFQTETAARNLSWARVSGSFTAAWAALRLEDVLHPIETVQRIVGQFRPLFVDLVSFAGAALMQLLELIYEAAMGAGGRRILAILMRARATFIVIIRNPVGFLRNLLGAIGQGVRQFMANILTHLRDGVIAWLTGPVAAAGIQIPARWDLRGIIGFVLQILGLTWANVRGKLVRLIGEPAMAMLERGFALINDIRERGLAVALRERVTEFFGNLRDSALGAIRSFIQQRIVMAGITQLLSMLIPVAAILQAIQKTYTTIQFLIQRIHQILDFVESIVNSIAAIASGALGAAANFVERTMARTIPVMLDFLARFIGLGDVGAQVQTTIRNLQGAVDRMLDRAVEWIRTQARNLASRALGGDPTATPQQRLEQGLREGVQAVNRLPGNRVGAALIRPLLAVIRSRHQMQSLDVQARGTRWAVVGRVNPGGVATSDKEVQAEGSTPSANLRVGAFVQLPSSGGGWSVHRYVIRSLTVDGFEYAFDGTGPLPRSAMRGGRAFLAGQNRFWRMLVAASVPLTDPELDRLNGGPSGTATSWTSRDDARKVLNYRHHISQFNPSGKDWEHIVEHSGGGANSVNNLTLLDSRLNRVDLNQWFGSRQASAAGFPNTGPMTVREYLDSISANDAERRRWKFRAYRNFRLSPPPAERDHGRGRYQVLE